MKDQHKHITGYRDLSPVEISLMNEIKAKGAELLALHEQVVVNAQNKGNNTYAGYQNAMTLVNAAVREVGKDNVPEDLLRQLEDTEDAMAAFQRAEPLRWSAIGRSDIQQGIMALIRAVAMPDSPC